MRVVEYGKGLEELGKLLQDPQSNLLATIEKAESLGLRMCMSRDGQFTMKGLNDD